MKDELRSLSLAVLLSFIAIYTVNYFFGINKQSSINNYATKFEQAVNELENTPTDEVSNIDIVNEDVVIAEDKRLSFNNNTVHGTIRLKGSRFDELYLNKYNATLEDNSPKVELLKPAKTENHYFAEYGWLSLDKNVKLPNAMSEWKTDDNELSADKSVTLLWSDNNGIIISRKISMDSDYLFTITDTITNNTNTELETFPYARISRNIEN